jgi:hypothetical protein
MNEQEQEENNLARLIEAGLGKPHRPDPSVRSQTRLQLQAQLRTERQSVESFEKLPDRNGQSVAQEPISGTAKRRARQEQNQNNTKYGKETLMRRLFTRWGFGLSATAAVAAIVLVSILASPKEVQGKAAEVMTKGARALAKLSSVHFQGQMRTAPRDNFSAIMPEQEFAKIELWKQFEPDLKWRVEKPGRIAVMDGTSSVLFIKPDYAVKGPPSRSAFDTDLFHHMADLSDTLLNELSAIRAHGFPVTLTQERAADGKAKSVVTVQAKSGLADGDYLKNKFFTTADTRRVYVFDDQTELLESVKVYLSETAGENLIFELNQLEYNHPIDVGVFQLQLPDKVNWKQDMETLPDNAKYAAMTPEQAARAFLEACSREDWTEAGKFNSRLSESFKQDRGGLQLISLGKAFTAAISRINGAQFVPYEIKYKNGEVVKHNLALKKDSRTGRWFVDGGI